MKKIGTCFRNGYDDVSLGKAGTIGVCACSWVVDISISPSLRHATLQCFINLGETLLQIFHFRQLYGIKRGNALSYWERCRHNFFAFAKSME